MGDIATPHRIAQPAVRWVVPVLILIAVVAVFASLEPIQQSAAYHGFADNRQCLGIPNCLDVLSSLPFLIVGAIGLNFCLRHERGALRYAWMAMFAGVLLVGPGSVYYHWRPDDESLVWDRLPMTLGFMGLMSAIIGEFVHQRLGRALLVPALLFGLASVIYWRWSGDLRPYILVQGLPLLLLPLAVLSRRSRYSHTWLLLVTLFAYCLAKITEIYDVEILQSPLSPVSGHTLKHLFAALACYSLLAMLARRHALPQPPRAGQPLPMQSAGADEIRHKPTAPRN